MSARLPSLSHLSSEDYEAVYEPSDDTWLLCDSLLSDFDDLARREPSLAVEIGPGSGAVCNFIARTFAERSVPCPSFMACDVNPVACSATLRTAAANAISAIDAVNCDLLGAMGSRLDGRLDLLVFNPPYVPTPSEEVGSNGIAAAWAGGENGREVIDRLLPAVPRLLSRPLGVLYLLLVEENRPAEVAAVLRAGGLRCTRVGDRKAKNERLLVLKAAWPEGSGAGGGGAGRVDGAAAAAPTTGEPSR